MIVQLPTMVAEADHYPRPIERSADRWVHVIGLAGGAIGGLALLGLSLGVGRLGLTAAVGLYGVCLVLMFLASTAYNLAGARGWAKWAGSRW